MADRTGKADRAVINVSPVVRDLLNERIAAVQRLEGRKATQEDMIAALLEGVPPWQAALMLDAYNKQSDSRETAETG